MTFLAYASQCYACLHLVKCSHPHVFHNVGLICILQLATSLKTNKELLIFALQLAWGPWVLLVLAAALQLAVWIDPEAKHRAHLVSTLCLLCAHI